MFTNKYLDSSVSFEGHAETVNGERIMKIYRNRTLKAAGPLVLAPAPSGPLFFFFFFFFFCLFVLLSCCLVVFLSFCLFVFLSISILSFCLVVFLFIIFFCIFSFLPFCLFVFLSFFLFVFLSFCHHYHNHRVNIYYHTNFSILPHISPQTTTTIAPPPHTHNVFCT